jgi:cobalamin-dependent methionine synthase I
MISVGLSNVSNAVPNENRPLINRVCLAMLMGAGLKMMIANPIDEKQNEVIRIIERRDDSTPLGRLYLKIADRVAAMEEPTIDDVDMSNPEQRAVWKTVQVLLNKVIYADAYLQQ